MPEALTNGIRTHYEMTGSGPALVLVSGLGGTGSYWRRQVEAFSRHFTVVTYDQRGAGATEAPEGAYSVPQLADDLFALIEALKLERPYFIGHSTGGAIGQVLASKHPDLLSGMVQYATWPKSDAHFNWCFRMRLALLQGTDTYEYLLGSALFLYPPEYIRDEASGLRETIATSAAAFPPPEIVRKRIEAIMAHDALDRLTEIATPTMVLVAEDDVLTPPYHARRLAQMIPSAVIRTVPFGGHSLSETRPDLFNEITLDFLRALQSGRVAEALSVN